MELSICNLFAICAALHEVMYSKPTHAEHKTRNIVIPTPEKGQQKYICRYK